jgi:hypothetical protein
VTAELQVQENARRFATTREVWTRQVINGRLAALEAELATIGRRGRLLHVQHRSDRILAELFGFEPLTTDELARRTGIYYSTVYADLRRLCGSQTLRYSADAHVNAPGYPVVWHTWFSEGTRVTWTLTPEYRASVASEIGDLEASLAAESPAGGDES